MPATKKKNGPSEAATKKQSDTATRRRKTAPAKTKTPTVPKLSGASAKHAWIYQQITTAVAKTGEVNFKATSYKHFQEHGVLAIVKPLLADANAGLLVDFIDHTREGNHSFATVLLSLFDPELPSDNPNYAITARFPCEGVDSSDKGINKMLTNGHKYALQKFFGIPTDAVDDVEGSDEHHNTASTAKAKPNQIHARSAAKIRATAQEMVDKGLIDAKRISAVLQGSYGKTRITELTEEEGQDFLKSLQKADKAG